VVMWIFIASDGIAALPLLAVLGVSLFATGPVLLASVQDIETDHPAFFNGIFLTIVFVIGSAAAVLVGFLGDRIGLETTYKVSCVLALCSVPFVAKLPVRSIPTGNEP